MEDEAAFRGPYRASSSRVSQSHGVDESRKSQSREARERGGMEDESLPRNDVGLEHCAEDGRDLNPTASSSSSVGKPAAAIGGAIADSTSGAYATGADGTAATVTHTQFSVEVSYLEIYNESLRDLFNPATPAAAGSHGGNSGGSSGEWGVGVAGSGGGGGGCVSAGNGLRIREDPR